jgi:hypothetical protein
MISGHDIVIRSHASSEFFFEDIVRIAKLVWKDAVVENGATGEVIDVAAEDQYAGLREIMIYKNSASRKVWDDDGMLPSHANEMAHIMAGWDGFTVVVNDLNHPETKQIVDAVRSVNSKMSGARI